MYTKSNLTFSPPPLASFSTFFHAVPLCLPVMLSRPSGEPLPSSSSFFCSPSSHSPPPSLFSFFSNDPSSACFREASSSPSFSAADLLHSTPISISIMCESTSVASLPEVLATAGFYSSHWSWFLGQDFCWTRPLTHSHLLFFSCFCYRWIHATVGVLHSVSFVVCGGLLLLGFVVLRASCSLPSCISVCC